MRTYNSIAVFDLDGTLWVENSHLYILNQYYKTSFFNSIYFKILYKIFPWKMQTYIDRKIAPVPKDFIDGLNYTYNRDVLELLHKKEKECDKVLIITNAPAQIVAFASSKFSVTALHAPIGKKLNVLREYCSYNSLFVCTDNRSDHDLIKASNSFCFLE
jgi:hypothetical protein